MSENVKTKENTLEIKEIIKAVTTQVITAVCGFITSRAPVMQSFSPFGIAFTAGMPKPYILSAGIGAAIGYFAPVLEGSGFRYFAALFAVCTIKLLLYGVGKLEKKAWLSSLICFSATAVTALAVAAGGSISPVYALIESVLAAAGAFFVHKTQKAVLSFQGRLSGEDLACTVMTINILFMGLYPIVFSGLSAGRILAAALIMTVALYGRAAGGAIAGCTAAFFIMLCGGEFASAAIIFAVGGLLTGVFSPLGKIVSAITMVVWGGISALLFADSAYSYLMFSETAFGAVIFMLLPKTFCVKISKFFTAPVNIPSLEGLRRALTMRLFFASKALSDVSETVKEVASELSLINAPDFEWVAQNVKNDACKGCSLCSYCWSRKKKATVDALLYMSKLIKGGEREPQNDAPTEWRDRCLWPNRVGNATVRYYDEFSSKIAAEMRIEEVRGVVSDQFDGISNMLYDLATEFERCEEFDSELASRFSGALCDIDIRVTDCACKTDKYGRLSIEARVPIPQSATVNRMDILKIANAVCGREFCAPTITRAKNEMFMSLSEKANFTVSIGVSQHNCKDGVVCGDAYTEFDDGRGRTVLILSDGMGTGGRAAVDGAMASGLMERLLKAGFGYDCALRIVNSSLLFKSTDESLATLDISSIDLFTGKVELLKVGAAPTVIRRGGRTGKAQSTSLPAGILRDIGFDKATVNLRAGDILLMMSDGAVSAGTDWICAELEAFRDGEAQDLADKIVRLARQRRTDGHDDDITVIAAILEKAI
ncbi:MAG: SpoIIE family protein phosphatase [Clostridia bacterium]|nr:SpoIIE family protein phosphatase [Clostridia bacterium]MBQ5901056.1 SpoIIE family protein phosphatase [Clostridia bacterium]